MHRYHWLLLCSAWLVATLATAGALFIGEVMLMTPCVLCWYQRIFMFPIALVLTLACLRGDRQGAVYALALAIGGALTAAIHLLLLAGWIDTASLPCQSGVSCADQKLEILGGLPIPGLSLLAFLLILAALTPLFLRKTAR
ncbi:hypothetical protein X805_37440 [Sphaerotilus natans subsp. natans DSM 6575]|uniref:Disulfide bond formation protein B n=1 Tax=Sphaerotilus natans subsp. natans DSM 6575 TaxID=1286631 RepID=A0A059KGU5_9BURK|nr:disulfide bond formation protein B [Sphaerotilus natans]KDB50671.1 hypothetical protein X805_37440 [Sphaerotilus natans subsp. natans DSM 6575]SIR41439.1 disulfide bond formation protein DsbB [Sphaerotilus natans]